MRSLCKLVIQVGIIGYRNHAKRIISLLNVKEDVKIKYIFHPVKSSEKSINTNNISDLFKCDAIFIISPNHTHFEYIKKFIHNFNGYIFCEKIPVVSIEELEWLKNIPEAKQSKIFFNFNYRFRGVSELIKKYLNSEQIGRVIHINIISTHGLAFKQSYIDSWRSNTELNPHSVLETSTVHFIDLLNLYLGSIELATYNPNKIANEGDSFDTSHVFLNYKNDVTASILNSYAGPFIYEISIIGTNGFFTIRDDNLIVQSPRDTFDEKGFFKSPPIVQEKPFKSKDDHIESLKKSIDFFLEHVKNLKRIDLEYFDSSIETNRLVLDLINNFKEKE